MEVATQMTSQLQLSLFDTASVIQPAYKIGDLVEIRKKPIAASYVKKGDVVEIAAVHPLNGSIKFWNERSERWEFRRC
jgi:ribosomal protein S17